ncbi:MAG: flavin reductase [Bacteroidota bacterium]
MKNFKKISEETITDNPFKLIGKDWMLITAGNPDSFNTMTASWGGLGILWNKSVTFVFIRPQRYTHGFTEENEYFTLSFFDKKYKKALSFCGTHSGRDNDKIKETGLSPVETPAGNVSFLESRLVIECKKLYRGELNKNNFIVTELIDKNYPTEDFHTVYIGEITSCWKNE